MSEVASVENESSLANSSSDDDDLNGTTEAEKLKKKLLRKMAKSMPVMIQNLKIKTVQKTDEEEERCRVLEEETKQAELKR